MTSPGPFRSKLIPYVDQIKAWRRAGKTWKEVTEELKKLNVRTDAGSVCRFIKRWNKKPYAIGTEPIEPPASGSASATKSAPKSLTAPAAPSESVRQQYAKHQAAFVKKKAQQLQNEQPITIIEPNQKQ